MTKYTVKITMQFKKDYKLATKPLVYPIEDDVLVASLV